MSGQDRLWAAMASLYEVVLKRSEPSVARNLQKPGIFKNLGPSVDGVRCRWGLIGCYLQAGFYFEAPVGAGPGGFLERRAGVLGVK